MVRAINHDYDEEFETTFKLNVGFYAVYCESQLELETDDYYLFQTGEDVDLSVELTMTSKTCQYTTTFTVVSGPATTSIDV